MIWHDLKFWGGNYWETVVGSKVSGAAYFLGNLQNIVFEDNFSHSLEDALKHLDICLYVDTY
jgi:hypothetical protein